MFPRWFAECSAEYYIREGWLGYTYMEMTSPIYDTMVPLYPNWNTFDIRFDFVLTRDLNTNIYISLVILLLFKYAIRCWNVFYIYITLFLLVGHRSPSVTHFSKFSQGDSLKKNFEKRVTEGDRWPNHKYMYINLSCKTTISTFNYYSHA